MQVARWGNSLASRLPAGVVEALDLKEGADVNIHILGPRTFEIDANHDRAAALARLRALRKPLPAGWRFDRDDANQR